MQFCASLFTEVGEGYDWCPRSLRLKWSRTLYAGFDVDFFIPNVGEQKKNAYFMNMLKLKTF